MLHEIYNNYLVILVNDYVPNYIKINIAKDCVNVSHDIIKKLKSDEVLLSSDLKKDYIDKFSFIKDLSDAIISGKNVSTILPRYLLCETFLSEKDFVYQLKSAKLKEEEIEQIIDLLTSEKQYLFLQKEISVIKNFIDKLESRQFKSIDEIVDEAFTRVESLYFELMKHKLVQEELDSSNYIDFAELEKNKDLIFQKMKEFYSTDNQVTTGFKSLDYLFDGGFEKTRIYMFAGRPGVGKSILLLNLFKNFMLTNRDPNKYVLFITLENLTFENTLRLLCMTKKLPSPIIKNMIRQGNKEILNDLDLFSNGNGKLVYFPSRSLTAGELFSFIEQTNAVRKQTPYAIIIDYLDLMKLPSAHKELRHQLGDITLALKTMAVKYQVPVITATQLVKNAYNEKPELGSIKESSEKIDHTDVIGLLHRENDMFSIIIGKSRHSREGSVTLNLNSDIYLLQDPPDAFIKKYHGSGVNAKPNKNAPTIDNDNFTSSIPSPGLPQILDLAKQSQMMQNNNNDSILEDASNDFFSF